MASSPRRSAYNRPGHGRAARPRAQRTEAGRGRNELVELAERRIERAFVGQEQRRRNAIELRRRVVLDLAIRGDLAL
jgi:hypothetical protein